jgi:hypothetical protein
MKYRGSKYGRIALVYIIFSLVAGALFLCLFLWEDYSIKAFKHWPTTQAIVITREIIVNTNIIEGRFGNKFVKKSDLYFAFSYQVNGHNFVSKRFFPDAQLLEHADAMNYPVGLHFLAHYNPTAPEIAVVESGSLHYRALMLSIICLGLFTTGLIYNLRA